MDSSNDLRWRRAHAFTAVFEGGKVDDPVDRGGRTNQGVTQRVYDGYRAGLGLRRRDVWTMQDAERDAIYYAGYWMEHPYPARLPWPLSAAVYDISVNHGPGNASRMLSQARARAGQTADTLTLALALCDVREAFYQAIMRADPSQTRYRNGWLRRVNTQRAWLRVNASEDARVIMIDSRGAEVVWDGKPAYFGGQLINASFAARLLADHPAAGGPWSDYGLRVWRRNAGDYVLERT